MGDRRRSPRPRDDVHGTRRRLRPLGGRDLTSPPRLAYFYPDGHQAHASPGHPERPERIEVIVHALDAAGVWKPFPKLPPQLPSQTLLQSVHKPRHLETIERAARRGVNVDPDTYLTADSWNLALNAAGGAVAVASAVWRREAGRGFALCRPPGHHATPSRAMGFCLLNNVAIAVEALIRELGAERLAIVDIDLHHGNGTQDVFYERGDVFYTSTHQYPFYPGTGAISETGRGPGAAATLNLPLPPFSGDSAFRAVMTEAILPALDRFAPEMILVSAGMDAHWRDPLGYLLLSAQGYQRLVRDLAGFADRRCDGRIALVLEGGYDLEAGAACALGAVRALLGEDFNDPLGPSPQAESNAWRAMVDRALKGMEG